MRCATSSGASSCPVAPARETIRLSRIIRQTARPADLEAQWSSYLPAQLELVQNYQLVINGNYILFAVSEYAEEAVEIFNSYTN